MRKLKRKFKLNISDLDKDRFESKLLEHIKRIREIEIPIIVGGRTIADFDFWTEKGFLAVGLEVDKDIRFERLVLRDGLEIAKTAIVTIIQKGTFYILLKTYVIT